MPPTPISAPSPALTEPLSVVRKHDFVSIGGGDFEVLECRNCRRTTFAGFGTVVVNNRLLMRLLPHLRCRTAH